MKKKKKKKVKKLDKSILNRIWEMQKPEKKYFIAGGLSSIILGAMLPLIGLILSRILNIFYSTNKHHLYQGSSLWACMFLILAVASGIGFYVQLYSYAVIGESLTRRLREKAFQRLLTLEIGYFDTTSVGAITAQLAHDTEKVKAVTGEKIGLQIQNFVAVAVSAVIAFTSSWSYTLIILLFFPLIAGSSMLTMLLMKGSQDLRAIKQAGKTVTESVNAIRTVQALGLQEQLVNLYENSLSGVIKKNIKKAIIGGVSHGIGQLLIFAIYGILFYIGLLLVLKNILTVQDMLTTMMSIMFGAWALGQSSSFATDQAKARESTARIFELLDRKTLIDRHTEGKIISSLRGNIVFENVHFRYPARPDVLIFKGFNLVIESGKTTALVGASGSGKSTVIGLLERFYDPEQGNIFVDGINIRELQLQWLRSRIALVSQEPILFSGTIRENILVGKPDATDREIEHAVRSANAEDFINTFPDRYNTNVGDGGTQLSGGQKQRIAIARALVKNPDILMLDEATSALDNESERIVQDALDKLLATSSRTTIIIAHRLSTIQNADKIAVVYNGVLVEQGTHQQLMNISDGHYNKLVRRQQEEK